MTTEQAVGFRGFGSRIWDCSAEMSLKRLEYCFHDN